jgi:hypothetical protein
VIRGIIINDNDFCLAIANQLALPQLSHQLLCVFPLAIINYHHREFDWVRLFNAEASGKLFDFQAWLQQ